MGLLADVYLANGDAGATKYDSTLEAFHDRLPYKSITQPQLSTLRAILQGSEWDATSLRQFADVFHTNDGERLICRLPSAMLTFLTQIMPEHISAIATKWAAADELRCKPDDVRAIIEGQVAFAHRARQSVRNVYLWNSV